MAKKKCYNCGITESPSANIKTDNKKQLVWEMGMKDLNGLIMHLVYCRPCGTVNIYKPGWLGNIKFDQFLKYEILLDKIKRGEEEPEMLAVITPRIKQAMIEDGILPRPYFEIKIKYDELLEEIRGIFRFSNFSPDRVRERTELGELDEFMKECTKLLFSKECDNEVIKTADVLKQLISYYQGAARNVSPIPSIQLSGPNAREEYEKWYEDAGNSCCKELQKEMKKHWKWAGHVRGRINGEW